MDNIWILAQWPGEEAPSGIVDEPVTNETTTKSVAPDSAPVGQEVPQKKPADYSSLILFGLMFVLLYILFFRGPRKKQQQHKTMVQSLQKNNKVRTIGGLIGTIVDIKDDEITLKIDESNNTKVKITPGAVAANISKDKD